MSITSQDIKIRQSERMTDFVDGGGQMSATEVVDGVLDNVFSDRSELDAILGRVSLRKVYVQVDTATTDTYLGAFGFITDPPEDDNVTVSLFDTASWTDQRAAAESYVENYRIQGVKSQFTLYGNHIVGQQTVQIFCHGPEIASPEIGDVLELSVEQSGFTPVQQFIKVDQVASRVPLQLEDAQGTFTRDVIILAITEPLQFAFNGQDPPARVTAPGLSPTVIRFTQVSNSSVYYGIAPLTAAVTTGDITVILSSPFISVVPSSQTEIPLVDVSATEGETLMMQSGADNTLSISSSSGSVGAGASITRYFGSPFKPGTLAITIGSASLADDGAGNIASTTFGDLAWSGECDYPNGAFTIIKNAAWSGTVAATATPAGSLELQAYSSRIAISGTNRQQSYVFQLPTLPAAGTVTFDYLVLSKWVRLSDQGNGTLSGNPGEGTGTINYATGSMAVTLPAFPDNGSSLIYAWGTDNRARDVHGELTVPTPTITQQLAHGGNSPGTCSMSWVSATVSKSASVSASGVISGDATGKWDFQNGIVQFTTSAAPDAGFTYIYDWIDPTKVHSETFTPTATAGEVSFTLAHAPQAGSLVARWSDAPSAAGYPSVSEKQSYAPYDDGVGGWIAAPSGTSTVDYTTGAIVLSVEDTEIFRIPTYVFSTNYGVTVASVSAWTPTSMAAVFLSGTPVVIKYNEAGASSTSASETYSAPAITIMLNVGSTGPAVPGSVRLTFRGRTYVDRNGSLYYGIDPTTNAGTFGGTYDYGANSATLSDYAAGSNTVTVVSLLTRYVETGQSAVCFRTPGAPVKTGSFVWRAALLDGTSLTGSTDSDGNITGTGARGLVNWDTGDANIQFGSYVTAAGNESEPWYDVANIVGSTVWKPTAADPSTIFIGLVLFKSVPQSASVIGIDAVRLPDNGKVPGFQVGGVVAIHNTIITDVANPSSSPGAGGTTDLGRTRLAFAEVKDSAVPAVDIDPAWYTIDLQTGILTWANPLNLSAYTLPVHIRHRIEDIYQCTDLQVTGELTLQSPVTHDFPHPGTYASACLIIDDLQARIDNIFDQNTWTSVFSDILIGAAATASYNNVVFPITVTNDSCVEDRWAAVFQSTSTVAIIGEVAGNLGTFPISADIAPTNPVSGSPYFTIPHAGWGSGWSSNNVVRFNSIAATHPIWMNRCTTQGPITEPTDEFRLQIYGDAA